MSESTTAVFKIGDVAPGFELPDTDRQTHSLAADTPAQVVVFTCNHCPYALAWEERLQSVARDYADRGVKFCAINSNDAERYPRDSFDEMKQHVADADWAMPYLHDESQAVAHEYGAKTTPDVFVLDSENRLRYRGAPDADYDEPNENAAWLREALDDVLAGREVARAETEPVGCSIKVEVTGRFYSTRVRLAGIAPDGAYLGFSTVITNQSNSLSPIDTNSYH